ncbi:MAG: phosphonate ABC transporter ATP-binding protein [Betaproteobacteria bacterium]|nr:phosphonate ABC transporter ATP-binding protein [Betaproteobacteria bacterium]
MTAIDHASDTAQPLLEVRGLGVVYGTGRRALRGASLIVRPGEFLVLLGPSGAGKSTLLRAVNGLVPCTEGAVHFEGIEVNGRGGLRRLRTQVGMIFQQHQLIGRLTALDNALTGRLGMHAGWRALLPMRREDRLVALHALESVGLLDCALRRCDQLSGGQQQRVGIARALAQRPRMILADEPVASLDPGTAEHVLALIHQVCRSSGIAAMVSLHQVELARRFADRIVGISAGAVVFEGPVSALDEHALRRIYERTDALPAREQIGGCAPATSAAAACRPSDDGTPLGHSRPLAPNPNDRGPL